jgi:hypothetical protein
MKWITRSNVKVDRVACPWLILRFIDAQAEFLFVPEYQLLETARREGAIPFDASSRSEAESSGESAVRSRPFWRTTDSVIQHFTVSR